MTVKAYTGRSEGRKQKLEKATSIARLVSGKTTSRASNSDGSKTRSGLPTPAQQEALIIKYRLKARKLGRSILRRWNARMDLEEVDSVVDLSLCEAVKRFDAEKGASFMTFLFYHLKGNLIRSVATAATATNIPIYNVDEIEQQTAELEHFVGHQFRAMNSEEVADAVNGQEELLPDEMLWRKELHGKSSAACEKLDPLEREIIKRIFIQEQQILDIAASLGYSRCHISRVKKKALETLQSELSSSMSSEDLGKPQLTSEDDDGAHALRLVGRRTVHRRRPRSKVTRADRFVAAVAA